jgi:hypothetical protein
MVSEHVKTKSCRDSDAYAALRITSFMCRNIGVQFHLGLNSDLFCMAQITDIGQMFTRTFAYHTDVKLALGVARICNSVLIFRFKMASFYSRRK